MEKEEDDRALSPRPAPSARERVYALRLAANLKHLREARNVSLTQLSLIAAIDRKYLRDLEKAKGNPSIRMLKKLADGLDTSVHSLLSIEGSPEPPEVFDLRELVSLNLKRLRRQSALSREEVKNRMETSSAYLSVLESGQSNATLTTLSKAADGFHVDIAALFRNPPKPGQR